MMPRRELCIACAVMLCAGVRVAGAEKPAAPNSWPQKLSAADLEALPAPLRLLLPLHQPLGPPQPGDWLAQHAETPETYRQYLAARPVRATAERRTLYVQPLGELTAEQRKIVELTAEFLGQYYQLPVKIQDDVSLAALPDSARRQNRFTEQGQVLTPHLLHQVLKPRLPKNAVALIGFTATDLWPGEGWNFVFGEASLRDRVGVWSMNRFGDPSRNDEAFRLALTRTLKTAAHETGHMFSLPHCVYFECCMNGSNNLPEADHQPLWICPQCLAKLSYATGADPKKRFTDLAAFARREKLSKEQAFWERSLESLK